MNWMWLLYALVVLVISGLIGLHLGRFREAYTEMTGMMAGMTMGMLNGFLLGYASAAALGMSMFWGNIAGILLGLALGVYFGRAGGLMGIMDGGMGGVMGGSMGAMLAVMVAFPREGIYWTAGLLALLYIVGMLGLVALIEQSAPEHAAFHRVLPMFARAVAIEAAEERETNQGSSLQITDYYRFLGISEAANAQQIGEAYLARLASAGEADMERAELALAILTDQRKREVYDRRISESRTANTYDKRGDCCPPRKVKTPVGVAQGNAERGSVASGGTTRRASTATAAVATSAIPKGPAVSARIARKDAPGTAKEQSKLQDERELPVSWVGILAVGVTLVMLVAWWLAGQNTGLTVQATSTKEQLVAQAVTVPIGADGKQTLDFVVNGYTRSYEPKAIKVKKDVPVHFNISLNGPDPGCTRFITIFGQNANGVAIQDRATWIDFTPTKAGVFEINCQMRMTPPSYLVVTD